MAEQSAVQSSHVESGDALKSNQNLVQLSQIDYKTAIQLLNQLQTNAENIAQAIEKERSSNVVRSLEKTRYFLSLLDITPERLNRLRVIHVAGTKGKGSTCAFVESILRRQGLRTGFYSSPHLVAARERIRLDGSPLSEAAFTEAFAAVYGAIRGGKSADASMPAYFLFMTLMAFHVFLREAVDVAILEVGIGGEYDCTNVVPRPVVTGVTSLDLDHTKLLGETIEAIAWQKAGIFKEGVPAYTVQGQAEGAMAVLAERAKERRCPLLVAPRWDQYPVETDGAEGGFSLGINGEVQKINASLAVQLANCWLVSCGKLKNGSGVDELKTAAAAGPAVITEIEPSFRQALATTKWFGRCEVIEPPEGDGAALPITYFLDAAHTPDSMQNCRDWFELESGGRQRRQEKSTTADNKAADDDALKPYRILIFNCTGDRNPHPLLSKLNELPLDMALFTTNSVHGDKAASSDVANFTVTSEREREITAANCRAMAAITAGQQGNRRLKLATVDCISEAIAAVQAEAAEVQSVQGGRRPVHVLITGSVHLVGGFIGLLHPLFRAVDESSAKSTRL